jgi:hypothetical protein
LGAFCPLLDTSTPVLFLSTDGMLFACNDLNSFTVYETSDCAHRPITSGQTGRSSGARQLHQGTFLNAARHRHFASARARDDVVVIDESSAEVLLDNVGRRVRRRCCSSGTLTYYITVEP